MIIENLLLREENMKFLFFMVFLFHVVVFGENQLISSASDIIKIKNQEISSKMETCIYLTNVWVFTKFMIYEGLICPKKYLYSEDTQKEDLNEQRLRCVWEEIKEHFPEIKESVPDTETRLAIELVEEYFESSSDILNSISLSAKPFIGNLEEEQYAQCGEESEDMGSEELKKLLDCGLKVITDKKAEIGCS